MQERHGTKGVLGSAILLALFSCASRPPPPSDEEMRQAREAYKGCLHKAAVNLDDGVSDPSSIALSVRNACTPEHRRLVDLSTQDMSTKEKSVFTQWAQSYQLDDATTAVLQERRERKVQPPQDNPKQ